MKYHDARNVQQYAHILALICLAYERFQLRPKYTLVNGHEERYEVAPIRPSLYAIVVSGMADGIKCCLLGCKRAKSLTTIKRHIALCHKAGFKQRVEQQVKEVMDNTITETCGKYLSVFRIFHQKARADPRLVSACVKLVSQYGKVFGCYLAIVYTSLACALMPAAIFKSRKNKREKIIGMS